MAGFNPAIHVFLPSPLDAVSGQAQDITGRIFVI